MANKHELMAKLQAARQTSGKIMEVENQKAYPKPEENRQLEIPHFQKEPEVLETAECAPTEEKSNEAPQLNEKEQTIEKEQKTGPEKISYTTISVPKEYGLKAKLYATLLKVNMVEFTCGALDSYILHLQEANKLPKVDL